MNINKKRKNAMMKKEIFLWSQAKELKKTKKKKVNNKLLKKIKQKKIKIFWLCIWSKRLKLLSRTLPN